MSPRSPMIHVRIPPELKERLEVCAKYSGRSVNAEVVFRLHESLPLLPGDEPSNDADHASSRASDFMTASCFDEVRPAQVFEGLSADLMEQIRDYRRKCGLLSDHDAIKKLLEEALQARDTFDDVMERVREAFHKGKDIREIAQHILTGHALVESLFMARDSVSFALRSGEAGSIARNGVMKQGTIGDEGGFILDGLWPSSERDA